MNNIRKLSEDEFNATYIPPMRFMEIGDETSEVDLKTFVEAIIREEDLNTTANELEIDSIYQNADKTFEHILIDYGVENMFMVVVIDIAKKMISGYHVLDLNESYD